MLLSHLFSAISAIHQLCLTYLKSHEGGDNKVVSRSPRCHPGQRHVAELGVEVVVADGAEVAVSAGQVLGHAHCVREAQVVKLIYIHLTFIYQHRH